MAPSRRYSILVDGERVFSGPMRSCEVVFLAIQKTIRLTNGDPKVPINLVVELGGAFSDV